MSALRLWFERYGSSHRHPVNRALHTVCVPAIAIALITLLAAIPVPWPRFVNLGSVLLSVILAWYAYLSVRLAIGAAAVSGLSALFLIAHPSCATPLTMTLLFVAAWIGQFIGHAIEGRRPSFTEDLRFLLIGPLWVLEGVYCRSGLKPST